MFEIIQNLYLLDSLAKVMLCLIGTVGAIVFSYSFNQLKNEHHLWKFLPILGLVLLGFANVVVADNLILFALFLGFANYLLTKLMAFNKSWVEGVASGKLARNNFILSFLFMATGFALIYVENQTLSISIINSSDSVTTVSKFGLLFLLLAACSQSALFPFHKWLLSSLNASTPVSALMHAGLINAGGFILARFAPLYLDSPNLLNLMVIAGGFSVIIGTLWKIIQPDIKRMLACSTLSQMGFMVVECGLGLFPLAVAHIFWHGIFKAYLFLTASSSVANTVYKPEPRFNTKTLLAGVLAGTISVFIFSFSSQKILLSNTESVLFVIAFLSGFQIALTISSFIFIIIAAALFGFFYGYNSFIIEQFLLPMEIMQPQNLSIFHCLVFMSFVFVWALILTIPMFDTKKQASSLISAIYVKLLNSGQPHQDTITKSRNSYSFQ